LFDWPEELGERRLQLTDKIDLRASGENDRFSISQISPGYYDLNVVAFYVLSGRMLVVFYGMDNGLANKCSVLQNIEPGQIAGALNENLQFEFRALCLVMSGRAEAPLPANRISPRHGLVMPLFCEVNTMPKVSESA
jgi:hypothetical protein